MAYNFNSFDLVIKFSEKDKTVVLDINELFGIPYSGLYKVDIQFRSDIDKDVIDFISDNFRINAHYPYRNSKLITYPVEFGEIPGNAGKDWVNKPMNFFVQTYNTEIDAIYTLSFDKIENIEDVKEFAFQIDIYGTNTTTITKTYNVLVKIVQDASETIKPYKYLGNPIGDDMESFMLIRTNPKLTGNIKLVVTEDYHLYLDTFKVTSASVFNERRFRHLSVAANGNYAHDVKMIFSDIPKGVLFNVHSDSYLPHKNFYDQNIQIENIYEYGAENNNDALYSENMRILAPLHIGRKLPDYFCIFKTDTIINTLSYNNIRVNDVARFSDALKNGKIVKIFDLRKNTTIGQYLYTYANDIQDYISGSCHLQFIEQNTPSKIDENYRQGRNTWYGIDVDRGVLTKKTETSYFATKILEAGSQEQEKFNMFILNGYERNNLLYPCIINLEFMFNDYDAENMSMHNYFGLYLTENQFMKFNCISQTSSNLQNADIKYFDINDNELISVGSNISIIENQAYKDRLFFMSTNNDVKAVNSMNDVNTFIRSSVSNIPDRNICHMYADHKVISPYTYFLTFEATKQINPGEHFKIILTHDYSNNKVNKVFEIIASSDERLRYTKHAINPYISTNTVRECTFDINTLTEIYRLTFYAFDLNDPDKLAPLSEQLKRILACIRKFNTDFYVYSISANRMSIFTRELTSIDTVYFQHILHDDAEIDYIRYFNNDNIQNTYLLDYNTDKYPYYLLFFANNGLELTGNRNYSIINFYSTTKIQHNFVYQIDYDVYKLLKNVTTPLVSTTTGYYPLVPFDVYSYYLDYVKSPYQFNQLEDDYGELYTALNSVNNRTLLKEISAKYYSIISPFDVETSIVISPYRAYMPNNYLNICTPKTAALSIMGINNVKDIDTYINKQDKKVNKTNTTIKVKAGERLYIGNNGLRRFVAYKLLSGNIRNIPTGNNVVFVILDDKIVYTYNNAVNYENIGYEYLLIDDDAEIQLYDTTILDEYNYETVCPLMNVMNFYKDPQNHNKTDLLIPVVPTINCNWKSNGIYFDHNSLLNVNQLKYKYFQNELVGNFTENVYQPGMDNNNSYVVDKLSDTIYFNDKIQSIKDFILTGNYKYPIKKYLIDTFKLETAIGNYNKYIQTLEFIYFGLKFQISFTTNEYLKVLNIEQYNNYQIFVMNDYDGTDINEMFISNEENFILFVNHAYHTRYSGYNSNVLTLRNNLHPSPYNWYKAPYNYDIANTANISGDTYIFKKNTNSVLSQYNYFIENDLNIYDNEFSIGIDEIPYYGYIKMENMYSSFKMNDMVIHKFESENKAAAKPSFMGLMSPDDSMPKYYSVSPINDRYEDYAICKEVWVDEWDPDYSEIRYYIGTIEEDNNLYSFFGDGLKNYRQKNSYILYKSSNESNNKLTYQEKLQQYKDSIVNKDLNIYIIQENGKYTELQINKNFRPIEIAIDIPNSKYNHGFFMPNFVDIFEFYTNDEISDIIDLDCMLSNTKVKNINPIYNYTYNKIVRNGRSINENYFIVPTREMFTACWDNNIYRLYSDNSSYTTISGYITGLEDKTFFGSKCIAIHDSEISLLKYDYDLSNITEAIGISDFNDNTAAMNECVVTINITKVFYNNIISTSVFFNNWNNSITDLSKQQHSMNNYILNTIEKIYNVKSNFTLELYRKYDPNKHASDKVFIYDKPEDFSEYEIYTNFKTNYKIINNEVILSISIEDYQNYYYYPIIKINKY